MARDDIQKAGRRNCRSVIQILPNLANLSNFLFKNGEQNNKNKKLSSNIRIYCCCDLKSWTVANLLMGGILPDPTYYSYFLSRKKHYFLE